MIFFPVSLWSSSFANGYYGLFFVYFASQILTFVFKYFHFKMKLNWLKAFLAFNLVAISFFFVVQSFPRSMKSWIYSRTSSFMVIGGVAVLLMHITNHISEYLLISLFCIIPYRIQLNFDISVFG